MRRLMVAVLCLFFLGAPMTLMADTGSGAGQTQDQQVKNGKHKNKHHKKHKNHKKHNKNINQDQK